MIVLLVLLTFTVCILVNLVIEKRAARKVAAETLFHGGHTWARLEGAGAARVGIDEFALGIIGAGGRIELPAQGASVFQGRPIFSAVRGGKRVEFVSPLDGVVCGVNDGINGDRDAVRKDPYGAGWIVALRPSNIARNLSSLMSPQEAASWLEKEVTAFKEFLALHVPGPREAGATLPDGGLHVDGVLDHLDKDTLRLFERKFLR